MQSRPYETTVQHKYYCNKPAATGSVQNFSEYIERLFTLAYKIEYKFVYQDISASTEVLAPLIWDFNKCQISVIDEAIQIHLLNYCHYKILYFKNKAYGNRSNLVLIFLNYYTWRLKRYEIITSVEILCLRKNLKQFELTLYDVNHPLVLIYGLIYFHLITVFKYFLQCHNRFKIIFQISDFILNEFHIDSVMEVDETVKITNENLKSDFIKDKVLDPCYKSVEGKENEYSTVIRGNETMKESERNQSCNSVNCDECTDNGDVNEKIKPKDSFETVTNGGLVNCVSESDALDSVNLKVLKNETFAEAKDKLVVCNIKLEENLTLNELNGNGLPVVCNNKESQFIKSEFIDKAIKNEKSLKSCEVKITDCNIDKDRTKSKSHSRSNSLSHHGSSEKKVQEQSSHHSSSSSSRSKNREHKSSSHQRSSSKSGHERVKSDDQDRSKYESSDKKRSRSCHHKSDEKCHCKSRHSRHHSKKPKKYQSVKTQCTADEIAYELRANKSEISNTYFTRVPWTPQSQLSGLKYGRYYRIETDRNGGASIVHLYMDEIRDLSEAQMKECAIEFIKLSYSEDENECAYHVMGIVHGAAAYLPDLLDYMADHYPTLTVKTGSLASRDNHTTTMSQYRDEVYKTYSNGTFRYAPLDQLSICGVLGEEVGAYFPDFVARLEQSPFMKPVMPWSSLSVVETDNPRESNDGPIFWVRPGEQMLPANEALKESARPKKRRNNELDNLAYIAGSRSSEARESLFMDRTKAHADQVGVDYGLSNTAPTAAVGVLKSVNCGHPEHGNRATKDVIAFHAQDYNELLEILMLDLYEPPQTQCTKWIEVSKLNTLRREGIRYAHVQLHDNDVYYLPRKIIHQFQTISSVASVAWHIRYKDYFSIMGAPNLHTPTGINKGQVFYEKKNVAIYYPPVCENELLASVTNPGSPVSKTPKKHDKLKEYSPFKHSPRKNHKIHSPRSSSKKEKGSHSVPHTPTKKDSDSSSEVVDERKTVHSTSKDEVRDPSLDHSKKDRGDPNRKSHKSDGSVHNQSNDVSRSKKEKRDHSEGGSTHRKEVRNLDHDLDSKSSRDRATKSPSKSRSEKSSHENRRKSDRENDDAKSGSSSKHKKHEDSKSKSHHKHEKNSHKKVDSGCPATNDADGSCKTDGQSALKRRISDDQSCSSKRIKVENPDSAVLKNGGLVCEDNSELGRLSGNSNLNGCESKESDSTADKFNLAVTCRESTNGEVTDSNNISGSIKCETDESDLSTYRQQPNDLKVNNDADTSDLRQSHPSCFGLALNPPLPCTSPPSNPPLPPNSPVPDGFTSESAAPDAQPNESTTVNAFSPSASIGNRTNCEEPARLRDEEHSAASKDKSSELNQVKKIKKKIVRKAKEDSECYDLLGDIMSQMDKKK